MTREEAIKELKNIKDNIFWGDEYGVCFRDEWVESYEMAISALREQGATDNNVGGKWISVKERLPEPFVSVLVQMPGESPFPTVREGFVTKGGIWHSGLYDREPDEVTHWMPMPEPPKEGAE